MYLLTTMATFSSPGGFAVSWSPSELPVLLWKHYFAFGPSCVPVHFTHRNPFNCCHRSLPIYKQLLPHSLSLPGSLLALTEAAESLKICLLSFCQLLDHYLALTEPVHPVCESDSEYLVSRIWQYMHAVTGVLSDSNTVRWHDDMSKSSFFKWTNTVIIIYTINS